MPRKCPVVSRSGASAAASGGEELRARRAAELARQDRDQQHGGAVEQRGHGPQPELARAQGQVGEPVEPRRDGRVVDESPRQPTSAGEVIELVAVVAPQVGGGEVQRGRRGRDPRDGRGHPSRSCAFGAGRSGPAPRPRRTRRVVVSAALMTRPVRGDELDHLGAHRGVVERGAVVVTEPVVGEPCDGLQHEARRDVGVVDRSDEPAARRRSRYRARRSRWICRPSSSNAPASIGQSAAHRSTRRSNVRQPRIASKCSATIAATSAPTSSGASVASATSERVDRHEGVERGRGPGRRAPCPTRCGPAAGGTRCRRRSRVARPARRAPPCSRRTCRADRGTRRPPRRRRSSGSCGSPTPRRWRGPRPRSRRGAEGSGSAAPVQYN